MTVRTAEKIKVLVVDDHEMLLESLVRLLGQEPDIGVVAVASTATAAQSAAADQRPDVIVMDYTLPDGRGTDAAAAILAQAPGVKVILLTGSGVDIAEFEAARAGCSGYIEKTQALSELAWMIRDVHAGRVLLPNAWQESLPEVDELTIHYQPIVRLQSSQPVGFEALVRWNHPTRGLVLPGEFIALAEQTNLIIDIDQYVREEACRRAVTWSKYDATPETSLFMSVNVSGRELGLPDLPAKIEEVLSATGLEARSLVAEVTETYLVHDTPETDRVLRRLSELGVRIALDDFGTGYSSLEYLRRYPIDIIKLDRYFTAELPEGERARRLVEAVGKLASHLGISAEAEGIETAAQAECLLGAGWELGQGYYYAHPMPADCVDVFLS